MIIIKRAINKFRILLKELKVILLKRRDTILDILGFIIYTLIFVGGITLFILGVISFFEIVLLFIALLLAFLPLYLYLIKKRDQTLLICFTSKYLMEKDESRLDDLLGILIAGKIERLKLDPVDEFFKSIESFCETGDVEMRRRISEALPALYQINLANSKEIVSLLRNDWDENWKADNRRRTIESFNYLIGKDNNLVLDNINIIDKDEFITIIAMIEILYFMEGFVNEKVINNKLKNLKINMSKMGYSKNQINILIDIWKLLRLIKEDTQSAMTEFISISQNSHDLYLQIFAARNFRLLCNGYPKCFKKAHCLSASRERSLDFMVNFLSQDKHKYVRRPIAKERSLECLVMLLKNRNHKSHAKEIIWKLINDNDNIIRITSFDKIDNILNVDKKFGYQIINHLTKNEKNEKLLNRAKRMLIREF
ncbi:MAG: hypothetical protein ISS28_06750 [Candidatus Cloacimonetes bacterium]|nr:hypothetical protein [Candidatus Cloacimonadota bacterium]